MAQLWQQQIPLDTAVIWHEAAAALQYQNLDT